MQLIIGICRFEIMQMVSVPEVPFDLEAVLLDVGVIVQAVQYGSLCTSYTVVYWQYSRKS